MVGEAVRFCNINILGLKQLPPPGQCTATGEKSKIKLNK